MIRARLELGLAHLLLAGNDTVPISVWRGEGMCRLVASIALRMVGNLSIEHRGKLGCICRARNRVIRER